MSKHRNDYWRERTQMLRIAKGLEPTRDFVHAERFVKAGRELQRMEHLPVLNWPDDLYGPAMVSDSPVPKIGRIPNELKCSNPICPQNHNHAVSRVVGNYPTRRVLWYCKMRCKNMHLVDAAA